MIRIQLRGGRGAARRGRKAVIGMLAAAVVAGVVWLQDGLDRGGQVWRRVTAAFAAAVQPERAPAQVRADSTAGTAPAGAAPAPAPPDRASAPAEPDLRPRLGATCTGPVVAAGRLPAGLRVTAVRARTDGRYALEGQAPAAAAEALVGALDTLSALPSAVSLTYWRGGTAGAETLYQFAFEGQLPETAGLPLSGLGPEQVAAVLAAVMAAAQRSGLDWVRVAAAADSAAPPTAAGAVLGHHLRAAGTRSGIAAFCQVLAGLQPQLAVREVVVLPAGGAGPPGSDRARLFAAFDLMRAAPPGPAAPRP